MRRSIAQGAKSALRSPNARPTFICQACQRASTRIVSSPSLAIRATYSTTPRRQQQPRQTRSTQKETILPQTFYEMFPETFPQGPPPSAPFSPNLKQLHREFLQLQAKAHPDLASSDKKQQAEALSARINEAYKTLSDPLKRAQYLLSLQGIDVEDESAKLSENELLMEVMEAREAVDEVESEEDLGPLREENAGRIAESVAVLEGLFAKGEFETAAQEAVRLRYWMNIEESIAGWEKGVGGGVIHH